ncbi:cupredoxin domain-containing protein [Sphaerisporangium aureirubrum]|uniref:EfeO-type cupredoxin-like domain-containing protein n=1 Tax=Sphaerisporangium aureirubrum TaxID=1544736 RepID=A0ABW1ND48_9ACTN
MQPPRLPVSALLLLLLALLLAGTTACGGAAPPPAAAGTVKTLVASIAGGTVSPAPGRVDVARGQTVRITVTSDVADVLHVHGYDKSVSLRPGVAGTVEFVADTSGIFEVETHEQELQLFQLLVR